MAWFDDPNVYFRNPLEPTRAISQGDIVVAPTAIITPGTADTDVAAPSDFHVVRHVTLWRAADNVELPGAPSLSAEVRWGLAMVVPHNCALEKEWNERVAELVAGGTPEDQAQAEASDDIELDPYIGIAPILAYSALSQERAEAIARGNPLGSFPIPAGGAIPASYVDLSQMTTVRWELIAKPQRLAALSDLAAAHLGHRLAVYYAYRAKSKLDELEAAVGQRIVSLVSTPTARRLMVGLVLEDGSTLTLEGDRQPSAPAGPDRPSRGK
jgi:hypothetical protein